MSVGGALRAAAADFYRQSWRLLFLNILLAATVLAIVYASLYALPALLLLVLVGGPVAAAVMHCAVTLAQTEDLRLHDVVVGLRLHWLRGIALGGLLGAGAWLGYLAVRFYANRTTWPLSVIVADVLALFAVLQLSLWPLAVHDRARGLAAIVRDALLGLVRRPLASIGLGIALTLVNAVGVAAGVMPFLTLTIAYSFLAAAHFALPAGELRSPVPDSA